MKVNTLPREVELCDSETGWSPCLVGMKACGGAHYWARVLTDLGHEVRLISPQFVSPYVKSNKNDRGKRASPQVSRPVIETKITSENCVAPRSNSI